MVASALWVVMRSWAGVVMAGGAWCNTNSPWWSSTPTFMLATWLPMLLIHDPSFAAAGLAAGTLECPRGECAGRLGPWGHARPRRLRLSGARSEIHTPQRARCRACGKTHVLISTRSCPRRADSAETVGAALVHAASGLGHRRVAAAVDLPATTVRGWLRRARANSEAVRADATAATYQLDAMAHRFNPTGSALGDMVDAVGRAVAAWVLRFGPRPSPWQINGRAHRRSDPRARSSTGLAPRPLTPTAASTRPNSHQRHRP